ncbi:hypothetical protein [Yoonia sp. SS1-5]|uniref:Uncharacterized protein n=1 Tax=Yoonia rhodophyticola TaxID=3137370 RepID=A0AAN0NLB7_9RHOB
MTISIPGSTKLGLTALLSKKRRISTDVTGKLSAAKKPLEGHEVAKLFQQNEAAARAMRPAKLNDNEKEDRAQLNSLRGALYSKD